MVLRADGEGEPSNEMKSVTGFQHWFNKNCKRLHDEFMKKNKLVLGIPYDMVEKFKAWAEKEYKKTLKVKKK